MDRAYLVVVSEADLVAPRVRAEWGTLPATGEHLEGAAVRELGTDLFVVNRPAPHIHDERLDLRLPSRLRARRPTLVFPSIHRSQENVECLTTHALGNLATAAEVGGRARTVCPTNPRAMTGVLRRLAELGEPEGLKATLEATHHGPELALPAFFVEVGFGTLAEPPTAAVRVLASVIREIPSDPEDRVAFAVGGGHYAPHFTELALKRRWAFGHIVSRHSLQHLDQETAKAAYAATAEAEGILFARAQDAEHPALAGLAPRLRDGAAGLRSTERDRNDATRAAGPSGT